MSPREEVTSRAAVSAVPFSAGPSPVGRDRAALLYQELERRRPEVLDLYVVMVERLAEGLQGQASATCGVRSAAYRRMQFRIEHSLAVVDVCQLAHDAPGAVLEALRPLLALIEPQGQAPVGSVVGHAARVERTISELVTTMLEAADDGEVDVSEWDSIDRVAASGIAALQQVRERARRSQP